ncbi:MAG: hypothetical protein ABSA52_25195, partial [Candidatus Binatia bacterium]
MSGLFGRPSFAMLSPPIAFMGETVNLFISSIIFCYDRLAREQRAARLLRCLREAKLDNRCCRSARL